MHLFRGIDSIWAVKQTLDRLDIARGRQREAAMSTNNTPNWGGPSIGQRIDEAVELIEMELRHAIAYMNDAVIPQVRRESIQGLRTVADSLRTLADRFEQRNNAAAGARGTPTEDGAPKTSGEPRS
jgi:hypothetical protein